MKCLGINFTKDVYDLYTGTKKALLKEIKENLNKQRAVPCDQLGDSEFVKSSILPTLIYKLT